MKSIDILCVPSRNEGTPLVIMEAMAAKIPVVGSDAGGIGEVISHNNSGFVFLQDDIDEFYFKLKVLVDDEKKD